MPKSRQYFKRHVNEDKSSFAIRKANEALQVARATNKLLNVEYKNHDVNISTPPSSGGYVSSLCNVPQGDGGEARDGRSVKCTSIQLRAGYALNGAASATSVRTILVVDMQNQGTDPNVTDILDTASTVSNLNIASFPGRFKVIYDRTSTISVTGAQRTEFKHYKKLNFHLKFEGAAGSTVTKNPLYLLLISNEATNTPSVNVHTRLRFLDN